MKIIAIAGYKGVGKSYLSERLLDALTKKNLVGKITPFAEQLKSICSDILGVDIGSFKINKHANILKVKSGDNVFSRYNKITKRKFLQTVGDVLKSNFGKLILTQSWYNNLTKNEDFIIIDDLRFYHELDFLKQHFRPEDLYLIYVSNIDANNTDLHSSENELSIIGNFITSTQGFFTHIIHNVPVKGKYYYNQALEKLINDAAMFVYKHRTQ